MLFIKAQRRRKIAEGQVVTYNVKGRLLKYKKVNGKMEYVGVARGGSGWWGGNPDYLRCDNRSFFVYSHSYSHIGIRVALGGFGKW